MPGLKVKPRKAEPNTHNLGRKGSDLVNDLGFNRPTRRFAPLAFKKGNWKCDERNREHQKKFSTQTIFSPGGTLAAISAEPAPVALEESAPELLTNMPKGFEEKLPREFLKKTKIY